MTVPATPRNEATTAAETAARLEAATWTRLSGRFGAGAAMSGRVAGSVLRGEVMSSGGCAAGSGVDAGRPGVRRCRRRLRPPCQATATERPPQRPPHAPRGPELREHRGVI